MLSQRSIPTAEDRISALPDSLICHLLSFLPTKFSVATSILSKRWRPLWKSVLTLDFDDQDFKDFGSFRHFVYSVIISRGTTLPIRSFRIGCDNNDDFDPHDVNRFVHAAVERGLENFDLNVLHEQFGDLQKLASSIFSCRTLVVLKLSHLRISGIPQLIDLPLLKTLHLDRIFIASNFVDIINLFNGCPILEDLHTDDVQLNNDWHRSIEGFKGFPNLVRADLRDCVLNFPLAWLHNAKFVCVEINLRSRWIYNFRVPRFHNLTHMELIFYCHDSWPGKWLKQVLQHCLKLQNLTIEASDGDNPPTEDNDWNDQETVPECLSSQLRTCSIRGSYGIEGQLQFAKYILLNSKLLCTMRIESSCYGNAKHQIQEKISSYPRGSLMCKLLFD